MDPPYSILGNSKFIKSRNSHLEIIKIHRCGVSYNFAFKCIRFGRFVKLSLCELIFTFVGSLLRKERRYFVIPSNKENILATGPCSTPTSPTWTDTTTIWRPGYLISAAQEPPTSSPARVCGGRRPGGRSQIETSRPRTGKNKTRKRRANKATNTAIYLRLGDGQFDTVIIGHGTGFQRRRNTWRLAFVNYRLFMPCLFVPARTLRPRLLRLRPRNSLCRL